MLHLEMTEKAKEQKERLIKIARSIGYDVGEEYSKKILELVDVTFDMGYTQGGYDQLHNLILRK